MTRSALTSGDKSVDITGPGATVGARAATLTAPDLHLDGGREAAWTFRDVVSPASPRSAPAPAANFYGVVARGPGRLEHVDPEGAKVDPSRRAALPDEQLGVTSLAWTKGMRFNDATGQGEAVGSVEATTHPDAFTQNIVRGERLVMRTAPAAMRPDAPDKPADGGADPLADVKLLSAEAIAGEKVDDVFPKATAEQRIYVADDTAQMGRRLEKLTYIEGPRLVADEEHGVFSVPAAGRALVLDHSVARPRRSRSRRPGPRRSPPRSPRARR